MRKKGLKLEKSAFPRMLENHLCAGKIVVPAYKDEDEQIVQGLHEPIISEELFDKVQQILGGSKMRKKQYED